MTRIVWIVASSISVRRLANPSFSFVAGIPASLPAVASHPGMPSLKVRTALSP